MKTIDDCLRFGVSTKEEMSICKKPKKIMKQSAMIKRSIMMKQTLKSGVGLILATLAAVSEYLLGPGTYRWGASLQTASAYSR